MASLVHLGLHPIMCMRGGRGKRVCRGGGQGRGEGFNPQPLSPNPLTLTPMPSTLTLKPQP